MKERHAPIPVVCLFSRTLQPGTAAGALLMWYKQDMSDPAMYVASNRKGCIVLPDISCAYSTRPEAGPYPRSADCVLIPWTYLTSSPLLCSPLSSLLSSLLPPLLSSALLPPPSALLPPPSSLLSPLSALLYPLSSSQSSTILSISPPLSFKSSSGSYVRPCQEVAVQRAGANERTAGTNG